MQPQNQHGKNLDPHKARSSQDPDLLEQIRDRFQGLYELLGVEKRLTADEWNLESGVLVENLLPGGDMAAARECLKSYVVLTEDSVQNYDFLHTALGAWALDPIPGEEIMPVAA